MPDRTRQYQSSRKVRDQSTILLLLGLALLVSPMAGIFQIDAKLVGVPVTLLYLFAVWAGLIIGAYVLAKRLIADRKDAQASKGDAIQPSAPDTDA